MKSELIIDVNPQEVAIALLEDGRLMSLQKETRNIAYAVGDIYLAKVKKLMPGLNAAFVNVGYEKDAFLHYLDLGPHFASYKSYIDQLLGPDRKSVPALSKMDLQPDIDKNGAIANVLQPGQELLVQIVKEPISSKGPRLTTEITFTGRYLVLIPFSDKVSISQKIKSTEEKARLRRLIESIKPKNFGVILRTSAEGKRVAELNHELKTLLRYWEEACAKAQRQTAPSLVFEEESRSVGMLRDVFSPSFEAIHVNDQETFTSISNYVSLIAPDRKDIVKLYDKPQPIFDTFSVTRQIKSSFGKTVSFRSGAYIIIEHTEALHVIDVNSGNRTKAGNDQETNALDVNLRAADEIARQLRLRDMGGIIVVDFIDMARNEHRQQLYEHMKEVMANDRARHNILPLSKFGLMQITRQRVRPALDITVEEKCPSCHGRGEVQPSILFTDTLREKIEYCINTLSLSGFKVYVHPFVDAYLKKGWLLSEAWRWRRAMGSKFKVYPDESLAYLEYRIIDADGNRVETQNEKDTNSASTAKVNGKMAARTGVIDIEAEVAEAEAAERAEREAAREAAREAQQAKPKAEKTEKKPRRKKKTAAAEAAPQDTSATPQETPENASTEAPAPKKQRTKKAKTPKADKEKEAPAEIPAEPTTDSTDTESPAKAPRKATRRGSRGGRKHKQRREAEAAAQPTQLLLPAPAPTEAQ